MQIQILQAHRNAEALSGLLLNQVDEICVPARAVDENREYYGAEQNGKDDDHGDQPGGR